MHYFKDKQKDCVPLILLSEEKAVYLVAVNDLVIAGTVARAIG